MEWKQWQSILPTIPDNDEYDTFTIRQQKLLTNWVEPEDDDKLSEVSNMTVYQKSYEKIFEWVMML